MTSPGGTFRSGFVAVIGRPNTGKSTLVNALVGRKVAIVSDKPQTTRRGVRAIVSTDDHQIVFTDTPGFHKPRTLLGSRLNDLVGEATQGVDAVVQVVDAQAGVGRGDAFVFERQLRDFAGPKICAVNKLDALRNREEVPQLEQAAGLGDWDEVVPVSAKTGRGVGVLLDLLVDRLPEG
ncbi:MAG TPA: GTPase Era, partial [Actinomycetota bacterium]|nr:GTPase Era [Actinomycetota bacterium]